MKKILFLDAFQPWRKSENTKESSRCWQNCCCSLQKKVLTQFVVFGLVAVLLQRRPALCLSPCTKLTSIWGLRIYILFTVFYQLSRFMSTTTGWSVYNHNISITVKRAFKVQNSTKRHIDSQKFPPNPKLHGIPLYGFLSVSFQMACVASEGADVFTQLCRDANTVTQLHKTPAYWLILAQLRPAPDATFPLYSWSQFAQGLLEMSLFSCAASLEPLLAGTTVAVQNSSLYRSPFSLHTQS